MKMRYRLVRRGERNTYYCFDTATKKRASLETADPDEAQRLIDAKNDSLRQPSLNLNIARAYLAGTDSGYAERTWQDALNALTDNKQGETKARWLRATKDKALKPLLPRCIAETQAEHLFAALKAGTVSTNVHLRKLHNFILDMGWSAWPLIPKRQWPGIVFKDKRAITLAEHQKIIQNEQNPERKAFYELCWFLGAAQGDVASLSAEDVDWKTKTIGFGRAKTGVPVIISFSAEAQEVLERLPMEGQLFPNFSKLNSAHRATEFQRACRRVGVAGVTLHSYRYAWAQRAKVAGFPLRFAQEFLGHQSKAVHRAYAKNCQVRIPSLEEYSSSSPGRILSVQFAKGAC
jgi:integrase